MPVCLWEHDFIVFGARGVKCLGVCDRCLCVRGNMIVFMCLWDHVRVDMLSAGTSVCGVSVGVCLRDHVCVYHNTQFENSFFEFGHAKVW